MPYSLYTIAKTTYRTIVPRSLDRSFFDGQSAASRLIIRLKAALEQGAPHDDLYDATYYARQEEAMRVSSGHIAESIAERMPQVRTVIDVGCGSGAILGALRDRGLSGRGLDYSEAALDICREKGLDVLKFDLESGAAAPDLHADLALSTEVAEHLPAEIADPYVDFLTGISDTVLMTAATPGQGGTDHVNEQPNAYWIEKFADRGFGHDAGETEQWRADWKGRGVDRARAKNVMIFRRTDMAV